MDIKTSSSAQLAYAISCYMYREGIETIELTEADLRKFNLTKKELMAGPVADKYIFSLIDAVPSKG